MNTILNIANATSLAVSFIECNNIERKGTVLTYFFIFLLSLQYHTGMSVKKYRKI